VRLLADLTSEKNRSTQKSRGRLATRSSSMTSAEAALGWVLVGLLFGLPQVAEVSSPGHEASWSQLSPGDRMPADVPQFVAITFDDNFGLALPGSVGGVRAIVKYYAEKHNPAGAGNAADFDGVPIRASFFDTSIYMVDSSERVLGGNEGEDQKGRNRAAWKSALAAGHEIADHTVNHFNGGGAVINQDDCCRARDWSVAQWSAEIASCRTTLTEPHFGLGAKDVIGFRAPYLSYNDNLFTALQDLGFAYDSSLPNCFNDEEDGTNCSWPYTLDEGSPDADALARVLKRSDPQIFLPTIKRHSGLWELPITTLIVPADSAAGKYHFRTGLRERIAAHAPFPYPSIYDAAAGKITGLDYTLLIDAGVTGDEMRAILEYNLDLHLSGNHSPLNFVAHAHLYALSNPDDNPDTLTNADRQARWNGLTDFIAYALTKPDVRVVADEDVLAWMRANMAPKL
jgi:Polysaccharide deacetylase